MTNLEAINKMIEIITIRASSQEFGNIDKNNRYIPSTQKLKYDMKESIELLEKIFEMKEKFCKDNVKEIEEESKKSYVYCAHIYARGNNVPIKTIDFNHLSDNEAIEYIKEYCNSYLQAGSKYYLRVFKCIKRIY